MTILEYIKYLIDNPGSILFIIVIAIIIFLYITSSNFKKK